MQIAGAPLFPNIDLDNSASVGKSSSATGSGNGGNVSRLYASNLSASYVLDFWGKNQSTLAAVEENATASRYNNEVVTLTTISTVATTYFTILGAQDELRILHKDVDDFEPHPRSDHAAVRCRHGVAGQRGTAAERGGDAAGLDFRRWRRRCSRIWRRSPCWSGGRPSVLGRAAAA